MPRVFGIQAAGSDYLTQAFESGEDVVTKPEIEASTVADSIWAGLPRDRVKALAAVVDTDGEYVRVTDEEILAAIPQLASATGVFAEPAAAAGWAGVMKARVAGLLTAADDVVVISTGSGLKDVPAAMRAVGEAGRSGLEVDPGIELDELRARLT
jgi:threonine synthase